MTDEVLVVQSKIQTLLDSDHDVLSAVTSDADLCCQIHSHFVLANRAAYWPPIANITLPAQFV